MRVGFRIALMNRGLSGTGRHFSGSGGAGAVRESCHRADSHRQDPPVVAARRVRESLCSHRNCGMVCFSRIGELAAMIRRIASLVWMTRLNRPVAGMTAGSIGGVESESEPDSSSRRGVVMTSAQVAGTRMQPDSVEGEPI